MGLVACAGHRQKKTPELLEKSLEKILSKFSVNYSIQILPVVFEKFLRNSVSR